MGATCISGLVPLQCSYCPCSKARTQYHYGRKLELMLYKATFFSPPKWYMSVHEFPRSYFVHVPYTHNHYPPAPKLRLFITQYNNYCSPHRNTTTDGVFGKRATIVFELPHQGSLIHQVPKIPVKDAWFSVRISQLIPP